MAKNIKLIDIGANLSDGMFKGVYNGKTYHSSDLKAVLGRAWDVGVNRIIVTGGSLEESKEALAIAETDGRLFCTVGVHPTRCKEFELSGDEDKHLNTLLELAKEGIRRGKVVAIGECGLDYDRLQFCPASMQRRYFEKQFHLAEATGLPMFLHMRGAANDFLEIIEHNKHRFKSGVVHSFTGTADDRDRILQLENLHIGLNGCSLKTLDNLQVMAGIPLERMMIETDSPYCEIKATHAGFKYVSSSWPSKKKEKHDMISTVKSRNEPCHIKQVLEVIAGYRSITNFVAFAEMLYCNACRVFFPHDLDSLANSMLLGS